jgi:methionyl-tRNA formyltransferase
MADLSVLILCGRSPRHLYVANRLCRSARALAIVQETGTQLSPVTIGKLEPARLWHKGWRWLRDRRRYVGDGEARFFFGDASPKLDRSDLVFQVPHVDDRRVVDLAERLDPDIIAVFGTSLIKGRLLEMGRRGIVNLHGGLSPEYRGADCTFWALYNGEPEKVGCTIHFIDAGIDTGNLIAHVSPDVCPGDDELTLFWRAIKDSAETYAELLDRLGSDESFGQHQTEKGRLYQVKDRRLRHERELDRRLAAGMLDRVVLPKRVTWFVHPTQCPPVTSELTRAA